MKRILLKKLIAVLLASFLIPLTAVMGRETRTATDTAGGALRFSSTDDDTLMQTFLATHGKPRSSPLIGPESNWFGHSVALSGDAAVIGASGYDAPSPDTGAAYIFVRNQNGWQQQAKLTASDAASSDLFGYSVAIAGDTIVIGAPADDVTAPNEGSAYVFVRAGTTWTQQSKISASGDLGDHFGWSVSISGETVVIGAPGDDVASSSQGSAYVYVRSGTNWILQQRIAALDGARSDEFGSSVAISSDTVIIGSPCDDVASVDQGSAYIYVRSGSVWTGQAKISAIDGAGFDSFGMKVALSADTAVIGAPFDDVASTNQGSIYIFVRSGTSWFGQAKITALDGEEWDNFGADVSLSGNTVIVGSYRDDVAGPDQGSAYIYIRSGTTWMGQAKVTAIEGSDNDLFGWSVAISGDTALIGAVSDDVVFPDQGSAYPFTRVGGFWSGQSKLTSLD